MPLPAGYTTEVDAVKTAAEITQLLAKYGATKIATDYHQGRPSGLSFRILTEFDVVAEFELPVDVDRMHVLMKRHTSGKLAQREQAERVAWRVIKIWLQGQLALLDTQMVRLEELMLPWMHVDGTDTTVLDVYRSGMGRLALEAGHG